jgi:pimeloyl-ACP methyl ester carboxylesterase
MGLQGLTHTGARSAFFRRVLTRPGTFQRGSLEWMAEAFLQTVKGDPIALLHVLDTFVDTSAAELARIGVPSLVVAGTEDNDNGSAEELAGLLLHGSYVGIPGNHMSAVTRPELGRAFLEFLQSMPTGASPDY